MRRESVPCSQDTAGALEPASTAREAAAARGLPLNREQPPRVATGESPCRPAQPKKIFFFNKEKFFKM